MEIPKALFVLKEFLTRKNKENPDWKIIRKIFSGFLNNKRQIEQCNLSDYMKLTFEMLLFENAVELIESKTFESILNVKTYSKNVLSTLRKLPYDSGILCFINDSYHDRSKKSGNKKYINC